MGGGGTKGALIGSTMDPLGGALAGGAAGHAFSKGGKSAQGPATSGYKPPQYGTYYSDKPHTDPYANMWAGAGQQPQWAGQTQGKQGSTAQGPQTAMSQAQGPTMKGR